MRQWQRKGGRGRKATNASSAASLAPSSLFLSLPWSPALQSKRLQLTQLIVISFLLPACQSAERERMEKPGVQKRHCGTAASAFGQPKSQSKARHCSGGRETALRETPPLNDHHTTAASGLRADQRERGCVRVCAFVSQLAHPSSPHLLSSFLSSSGALSSISLSPSLPLPPSLLR